ncbi:MAG: CotH kinase family protein [Rhodothermales bacterium]
MKKTIYILALFFGITPSVYAQNFYDIDTINTIELTFTESNWDQILDDLYAEGEEDRLVGTAIINGVQYDSVGVRYKGNSTYNPNQIKNPLNIKLDHVVDDQDVDGYGTLKLANVTNDPSFMREVLGYEIARKYMPASEANFANVYINGQHLGLYSNVQSVDKFFMGTHFKNDENARFKGELAGDGRPSLVDVWNYRGADSTAYFDFYELKSDYGWDALLNFLDIYNNAPERMEDVLNVDLHLWMLAYDILMVNLDAPVNFAHNYYLFQDNTGRFNPIIWDLNENFGVFTQLLAGGQLNPSQMDPFLNATHPSFPIVGNVLSDPTYRKIYVAHMKTIMEEIFSNQWYKTRIQEIQNVIDADVQADPNKFYTYNDFLSNVDNAIGGGGPPGPGARSVIGITELMDARVEYISAQSEFQAIAPAINNLTSSTSQTLQYSQAEITAEVSNTNSVILAYRNSTDDAFTKVDMKDDGANNDGLANDGIYGVSVSTAASDVQYYLFAENDEAATFSPARAAYEFYTIQVVAGDVVINEFMADNDTVNSDQDGDFDDWIELYNVTSEPISLNGYFLSDDGTDLTQWAFPDTTIDANGYLIIWADNDTLQTGLHANFGLSRNGDSIYLTQSDTTIISDEITFGAQTTDLSFGRFPNGTGDFIEMTPSFSTENSSVGVAIENEPAASVPGQFTVGQNYPNPFSSSTTIDVSLHEASYVSLEVYNMLGQRMETLVSGNLPAGQYLYHWQPELQASGVYFYTLKAGGFSETKKMFFLK